MSEVSVADGIRAAFNFGVQKFPLSGPDNLKTDWYGLFRDDNGQSIGSGSVSSRYVPHQAEDVVALVDAASVAFDDTMKARYYFNEGHYVFLEPSKDHRKAIFGTADNIFPRVIIRAGYDAQPFAASVGFWRDACKNMSIMRQVNGTSVSIRHTSGLQSKVDSLVESFGSLKDGWNRLTTKIEGMESRTVKVADFLAMVFGTPDPDSQKALTINKNRNAAIMRRLVSERSTTGRQTIQNGEVSLWEAYNGVQGFIQHDATRKNSATDLARIVMASEDKFVAIAEKYALQLAAA